MSAVWPKLRYLVFFTLVFLAVPIFTWADHCTVSQVAIIAGTWENTNTKTSYTIQAQDVNGESCHASQTLRLSFASTDGGTFTSQTGNPIQAWISTNSANRNFYYESGVSGNDVITIQAGYGTADSWETLFTTSHTVSSNSDEDPDTTTPDTGEPAPTLTTTTSSRLSSSGPISTHYSAVPITDLKSVIEFEISAGRSRLGIVGVPLEFKTETTKKYLKNTGIKWSLGDGAVKYGQVVTHSYEYPGNYVVVVNALSPEGQAVSRTNVKIIPADISISHASQERIEISNNSGNSEVNLYGRALVSGNKFFQFPQDTIVATKQKISFSANITGLNPTGLHDIDLMVIGENIRTTDLLVKIEEHRLKKIIAIQTEITGLEQRRLSLLPKSIPRNIPDLETVEVAEEKEEGQNERQTALALESASQIESHKIKEWLMTIKKFFLGTE